MTIPATIVALAVCVAVLGFALICGLIAVILRLKQGHTTIPAIQTGFAAAAVGLTLGMAMVGMVKALV
ncbi:hypothetical protein IU449_27535 [Nocardia higoensis]|uniref:DUF350 domain-containing protein n=1 Tax=Nocardia higoensis TaxID=228599 RepID=A0ABS0DIG8_9NOCA|nr:hypothetical protein [Nocardia higoensis]MBF6358254.1 hypothetical protein [Nocardia higoensis]